MSPTAICFESHNKAGGVPPVPSRHALCSPVLPNLAKLAAAGANALQINCFAWQCQQEKSDVINLGDVRISWSHWAGQGRGGAQQTVFAAPQHVYSLLLARWVRATACVIAALPGPPPSFRHPTPLALAIVRTAAELKQSSAPALLKQETRTSKALYHKRANRVRVD